MTSRPPSLDRPSHKGIPHGFQKAANDEIELVAAWLWEPVRQGLEWLLRYGARPSAEVVLRIQADVQKLFPRLGELDPGPVSSSAPVAPFPEARPHDPIVREDAG